MTLTAETASTFYYWFEDNYFRKYAIDLRLASSFNYVMVKLFQWTVSWKSIYESISIMSSWVSKCIFKFIMQTHVSPCRRLVFSYRHTRSESIYRHIQGWIDVSITSQACRLCATWSLHTQAVIWLYELWSWSLTGLHSVVVEWPVSLSPISCIRQQRFHFVKLSVTSTRHALEPARHVIWGRVSLLMEAIIEFFHPLLPTSTIWYRSKSLMPCGWKGNRVASHWPCVTNTSVSST